MATTNGDESASVNRSTEEREILNQILTAFGKLEPGNQERMLYTVATFLGIGLRPNSSMSSPTPHQTGAARNPETTFSEDRSLSPKQFMLDKQPKTDIEKVACLAYYLTHYQGLHHFKTLDISKLNTDAAQVKFTNAAVAVDNATKRNYLVLASKGSKQLSALGEQFVLALPDREKARSIMANARPRRRSRKTNRQQTEDQQ